MLPMVMPSNRNKLAKELEADCPQRLGLLLSPSAWANPLGLPYALDNGRFPVWASGKEWNRTEFIKLLNRAKTYKYPPLWVAVPDVVADRSGTLQDWTCWAPWLVKEYGFALAFVVQNGMTPEDVKELVPTPDVVFIGGTTDWKWRTLPNWCRNFPRVHVGRVNGDYGLWTVQKYGAESSDGTGWWHEGQLQKLRKYLRRSSAGAKFPRGSLFDR